jgi:hypothetical protein
MNSVITIDERDRANNPKVCVILEHHTTIRKVVAKPGDRVKIAGYSGLITIEVHAFRGGIRLKFPMPRGIGKPRGPNKADLSIGEVLNIQDGPRVVGKAEVVSVRELEASL